MLRIIPAKLRWSTVSVVEPNFPPGSAELAAALVEQQIDASAEQVELLDRYRRSLWSWNERLNLTRHTTLEKFVGRDIIDTHEAVHGADPFAGIRIDAADTRRALEMRAASHLLHLRENYVESTGAPAAVAALCWRTPWRAVT